MVISRGFGYKSNTVRRSGKMGAAVDAPIPVGFAFVGAAILKRDREAQHKLLRGQSGRLFLSDRGRGSQQRVQARRAFLAALSGKSSNQMSTDKSLHPAIKRRSPDSVSEPSHDAKRRKISETEAKPSKASENVRLFSPMSLVRRFHSASALWVPIYLIFRQLPFRLIFFAFCLRRKPKRPQEEARHLESTKISPKN